MRLGYPFFGSCDCGHTNPCAGTFGSGLPPYSSLLFKAVCDSLQCGWSDCTLWSHQLHPCQLRIWLPAQVASEMGMSTENKEGGQSWLSADSQRVALSSYLLGKWLFSFANSFFPSGHWVLRMSGSNDSFWEPVELVLLVHKNLKDLRGSTCWDDGKFAIEFPLSCSVFWS